MNNPNSKISVIVPVYNAEKYLPRCIDSILTQCFTNIELLLIDDGSKDKSGDICDGYAEKDKRVIVFHKENGGVSSARNLGLDKATGDYVTFVDADDYLLPESLTLQLLEGNYDLIQIPRNNGSFMKSYSHDVICNTLHAFRKFIYRNFYFECWGRLYKKQIIGSVRFPENLKVGEDIMFFLKIYRNVSNFKLSSKGGGYHYSFVPTSAMRANDILGKQERLAVYLNDYYHEFNDKLALIIMMVFFYGNKTCKVDKYVFKYPICKILMLPISLKRKVKYFLDRWHICKL